MMESFGVPENDIARWAGITSAIFCICQACTGLLWGAASDKYGRKPILLLGLINTMWTMILWGTSTSLTQALIARGLEGLGNGNVGILRTTVAEMCPWKELQPLAFSVMPMVWTVGAVIGPSLGGLLSNPLRVDPKQPRGSAFLERFPYILPNITASTFFAVGIITGWLFLRETLESKKHQQDLGLRTGAKLTSFVRKTFGLGKEKDSLGTEREPLLTQAKVSHDEDEQLHGVALDIIKEEAPRIRDVLSYQTSLNLLVYTLLAFYTMAYDQVSFFHPMRTLTNIVPAFTCLYASSSAISWRSRRKTPFQVPRRIWHRLPAHWSHIHHFRDRLDRVAVRILPAHRSLSWRTPLPTHLAPHFPLRIFPHPFHQHHSRSNDEGSCDGHSINDSWPRWYIRFPDLHYHDYEQRRKLTCLGYDQRHSD